MRVRRTRELRVNRYVVIQSQRRPLSVAPPIGIIRQRSSFIGEVPFATKRAAKIIGAKRKTANAAALPCHKKLAITLLLVPSAFCASRADPMRRDLRRRVGEWPATE